MTNDYRRLYRSRNERMFGGVAGGLGEFLTIDPTLIRLLFIISMVLGGAGLLAYIVMWVIVPEEPLVVVTTPKPKTKTKPKPKTAAKKKTTKAKTTS